MRTVPHLIHIDAYQEVSNFRQHKYSSASWDENAMLILCCLEQRVLENIMVRRPPPYYKARSLVEEQYGEDA